MDDGYGRRVWRRVPFGTGVARSSRAGPSCNVYDTTREPGGSSSGSAVACLEPRPLGRRSQPSHPRYHLRRRRLPGPNPLRPRQQRHLHQHRARDHPPPDAVRQHRRRHPPLRLPAPRRLRRPCCNPEPPPDASPRGQQDRPARRPRRPQSDRFRNAGINPQADKKPSVPHVNPIGTLLSTPSTVDRTANAPERGIVLPSRRAPLDIRAAFWYRVVGRETPLRWPWRRRGSRDGPSACRR